MEVGADNGREYKARHHRHCSELLSKYRSSLASFTVCVRTLVYSNYVKFLFYRSLCTRTLTNTHTDSTSKPVYLFIVFPFNSMSISDFHWMIKRRESKLSSTLAIVRANKESK